MMGRVGDREMGRWGEQRIKDSSFPIPSWWQAKRVKKKINLIS